jgi:elongation factor Ts
LAKQLATGPGAKTPEDLWKQPAPGRKGTTLEQWKDEIEGKMRSLPRAHHRIDACQEAYVHHDGKSGVLLEIEGGNDDLAKGIAIRGAMKPKATTTAELDNARRQGTRNLTEQARKEGSPQHHREDDRRMDFLCRARALRAAVHQGRQAIGRRCRGGGMKLKKFTRWQLGEAAGQKPAG